MYQPDLRRVGNLLHNTCSMRIGGILVLYRVCQRNLITLSLEPF